MDKINFDFKNRTALVTGGAQGFGLDIAKRFLNSGAKVIIWDIDPKMTEKAQKDLDNTNLSSSIVDVSNYKEVENCAKEITKKTNIDILINNAGIALPTEINDNEFESFWDRTHNVLLKGQAILIRECLPFIEKSDTPRIVNISSTEGLGASPMHSPYTSAKHGVIGLTRSLAVEFGKKFSVLGFDINEERVTSLNQGHDETLEISTSELKRSQNLQFTSNEDFLFQSNIYIVTVPTPIDRYKRPNLTPLIHR
mgnify:CR=1 FL=1